jgi:hypothetical protein
LTTTAIPSAFRQRTTKEIAILAGLLFFGLVVLPLVIFSVGQSVFGSYGGVGYGDFYGTLSGKVRNGDLVAWFLVLSPYVGWQIIRLMALAWRLSDRKDATS